MKSAAMFTEYMEKMAQERMSVVLTESHVMDALERLKKERETENEMGLKKREDEQQYVQEERRAQAGAAEQCRKIYQPIGGEGMTESQRSVVSGLGRPEGDAGAWLL